MDLHPDPVNDYLQWAASHGAHIGSANWESGTFVLASLGDSYASTAEVPPPPFSKLDTESSILNIFDCATKFTTHSFVAGTQVLMADGTTKNIEQVVTGDLIRNSAPETGDTQTHAVEAIHVTTTDRDFTDITLDTPGTPAVISSTSNHPYYDVTAHAWKNMRRSPAR